MKKNLITVLKKLLAAFGGEETNSNNAVEVIDKIADSVKQGDGGSEPFVVKMLHPAGLFEPTTLDKTWRKIKDAFDNNILVVLKNVSGTMCYLALTVNIDRTGNYYVAFMGCDGKAIFKTYSSDTETGTLTEVVDEEYIAGT